ncbi:hypothetical protein [Alkalihalobacillus sp. 1P02AB]|uniref:hypothetical protein n=1 Tax=Alkalihalobacillus sp. 1P02AB TaxID=3132260 RepID=UPI0039A6EDB8
MKKESASNYGANKQAFLSSCPFIRNHYFEFFVNVGMTSITNGIMEVLQNKKGEKGRFYSLFVEYSLWEISRIFRISLLKA